MAIVLQLPRWALAALLLSLGLLACNRPLFETPALDPMASFSAQPRKPSLESRVWLFTDAQFRATRAEEQRFSRMDTGLFWLNLLGLGHGPVASWDVQDLPSALRLTPMLEPVASAESSARSSSLVKSESAQLLNEPRLVVFSTGALASSRITAEHIRQLTQQGHTVVLEQPTRELVQALALAHAEESPQVFHDHRTYTLRFPGREGWERRSFGPFWSLRRLPLQPSPEVEVFLWAEQEAQPSVPLGWSLPVFSGRVVVLTLEISRLLLTHVQGNPQEDFSFQPRPREGALRGIPVPSDLVSLESTRQLPVLELLSRRLYLELSRGLALGDLWYFPARARGMYLSSHDEEGFGDRARFMAEEEARLGVRSTFFVLPEPMTAEGMAQLHKLGAEVAVHWHRGFLGGHTDEVSWGPLWWRSSAWTLAEQQARMQTRAGRPLPPITRIHGLQWDPDLDSTFRRMVAAGLRLDSSYGPHGRRGPYEFGWSHAFWPLDRRGERLPIYEVPFSLQDDEAPPQEKNRQLILAASHHHVGVSPIFHVNTMSYKPSVGILEAWREGYALAHAQGLWRGTYGELLTFLEARAQGQARQQGADWYCGGASEPLEHRLSADFPVMSVSLPREGLVNKAVKIAVKKAGEGVPPASERWVMDVGVPRRLVLCAAEDPSPTGAREGVRVGKGE
ncbi:MAG: hypothetical protein ACKO6N_14255 [Myxococcota bacterium]